MTDDQYLNEYNNLDNDQESFDTNSINHINDQLNNNNENIHSSSNNNINDELNNNLDPNNENIHSSFDTNIIHHINDQLDNNNIFSPTNCIYDHKEDSDCDEDCDEDCDCNHKFCCKDGKDGKDGSQGPMGPQGIEGIRGPTGDQGLDGPTGDQGLDGPTGPQGEKGCKGHKGCIGPTGPIGPEGPTGPIGPEGPTGPIGPEGPIGLEGPTGPIGPEGPTGPIGPEGPIGSLSPTFLHIYNLTETELLVEENVNFDKNGEIVGSCGHVPNTTDVWIWEPGYYYIYTNIYHLEACQFSLFKNNIFLINGTTIGSPTGSSQNSTSVIIRIDPSDLTEPTSLSPSGFAALIQLRNHSSFITTITLNGHGGSGYAIDQINAVLTIILLYSI